MNTKPIVNIGFALALFACSHAPVKQNSGLKILTLQEEPIIGKTLAGQSVKLGGLSGLQVLSRTDSSFELLSLTDRGPNGPLVGRNRSFLLPKYSPRFVKLRLNVATGDVAVIEQIPFHDSQNRPLSGLPPNLKDRAIEVPVDVFGHRTSYDANGVDSESLCIDADKTIWVGDEYGPDLLHFQTDGKLLERVKPSHGLPEWLGKRHANRGFEGIACFNHHVYPILQSSLPILGEDFRAVRLLDYDMDKKQFVGFHRYMLENERNIIGDIHTAGPGRFVVIEQNGQTGDKAYRHLFMFDISNESKTDLLDLKAVGYDVEKAEGVAVSGDDIILVSDNDFSLDGDVNFKTGQISLNGKKTVFAFIPGILKVSSGAPTQSH